MVCDGRGRGRRKSGGDKEERGVGEMCDIMVTTVFVTGNSEVLILSVVISTIIKKSNSLLPSP